ncbi:MAG TPA: SDR family oxidoreductase, partial [Pyrinomonadaceae bacterium]|nr:SDR family oxidoreductase [Pyrinomonadaceae bacterium]
MFFQEFSVVFNDSRAAREIACAARLGNGACRREVNRASAAVPILELDGGHGNKDRDFCRSITSEERKKEIEMSLKGKYALITGSSRGIGRGIALKLADLGVSVAINYFQNVSAANDTLARVRERGSDGFTVQADVSRPDEISRMFETVGEHFGKLDIFVSNARTTLPTFYQKPLDLTVDQWDTAMDSQAKAFLIGAQQSARLMNDGGRIITITHSPGGRT